MIFFLSNANKINARQGGTVSNIITTELETPT